MSLYYGFKDAISIAQKADNIELYRRLLDLSAEALELQNQVNQLSQENQRLKKELRVEQSVERHPEGLFITLSDDKSKIHYCSTCWGRNHKLIQLSNDRCWICDKEWRAAQRH